MKRKFKHYYAILLVDATYKINVEFPCVYTDND